MPPKRSNTRTSRAAERQTSRASRRQKLSVPKPTASGCARQVEATQPEENAGRTRPLKELFQAPYKKPSIRGTLPSASETSSMFVATGKYRSS